MRSVVVETRQDNILDVDKAQAKAIILEKIRQVIAYRRKDVENSLIATGSPISVRSLGKNQFNAAVMNRMSAPGKNGEAFRNDLTKLIVVTNGNELVADGFFKVGQGGTPSWALTPEQMEALQNQNVTGLEETPDGGVKETKQGQDVGEILGGSASVLHEIGGIIGLFTGTGQQSANNNALNQNQNQQYVVDDRKKTPWVGIIIGLVVIGAIVGAIVYFNKKKK